MSDLSSIQRVEDRSKRTPARVLSLKSLRSIVTGRRLSVKISDISTEKIVQSTMFPFYGSRMISIKYIEARSPATYFGTRAAAGDYVYVGGHQSDDAAISAYVKIR